MIIYLLIGMVLVMLVDILTQPLEDDEVKLTMVERVITVFLWPVFVIIVIVEVFKHLDDE